MIFRYVVHTPMWQWSNDFDIQEALKHEKPCPRDNPPPGDKAKWPCTTSLLRVQVGTAKPVKPCCAWVSKVGSNTSAALIDLPFAIEEAGEWLITIMTAKSEYPVINCGSVLVKIANKEGTQKTQVVPFRYREPTKKDDNYAHCVPEFNRAYTLQFDCANATVLDLNLLNQTQETLNFYVVENNKICEKLIEDYKDDPLLGYARDIMLLFPESLVPSWYGIDPQVRLNDTAKHNALKKLGIAPGLPISDKDACRLAGVYNLDKSAQYYDEPIDNLAPWQATFFRGDDCDGTSMAAYALFTSLFGENESFLVSGEAILSSGKYADEAGASQPSGHSWVMRRRKDGSFVMCETTACIETSDHFSTAAFAWSSTCAYTFCTKTPDGFKLGVNLRQAGLSLPIAEHSEAQEKNLGIYLCKVELPKTSNNRKEHLKRIYSLVHTFNDNPTGQSLSKFLDFPQDLANGNIAATMGNHVRG